MFTYQSTYPSLSSAALLVVIYFESDLSPVEEARMITIASHTLMDNSVIIPDNKVALLPLMRMNLV